MTAAMAGPLNGLRIVEMAGIGPGPFAAMLLADMGAEVVRVDRVQAVHGTAPPTPNPDVLLRGRRNVAVDLKQPDGLATVRHLVDRADALIEGFRPGVMERLGLGPDECLARNPRLVYGRMTGWGQEGPYATSAGHDINYIALAGTLAHIRRAGEAPLPPLNLVGDFGGGGMFLAFGVVCGLLEAARSGIGQVVDAAMVDGTATLMTFFMGMHNLGQWDWDRPGHNLLDTGAHFYEVYECSDGEHVSVGAIEPQFYAELVQRLGLADDPEFAQQWRRDEWPTLKERLRALFLTRSRAEWCEVLEHTDACFAPVLRLPEAAVHPHNVHRGTYVEHAGQLQPAPAPRFSRSAPSLGQVPAHPGQHTREVLVEWGIGADDVDALLESGAVASSVPSGT